MPAAAQPSTRQAPCTPLPASPGRKCGVRESSLPLSLSLTDSGGEAWVGGCVAAKQKRTRWMACAPTSAHAKHLEGGQRLGRQRTSHATTAEPKSPPSPAPTACPQGSAGAGEQEAERVTGLRIPAPPSRSSARHGTRDARLVPHERQGNREARPAPPAGQAVVLRAPASAAAVIAVWGLHRHALLRRGSFLTALLYSCTPTPSVAPRRVPEAGISAMRQVSRETCEALDERPDGEQALEPEARSCALINYIEFRKG